MDREIRKEAWKRVRKVKRFYYHFATFAILGLFFFLCNVTFDPYSVWFYFPLIPWGAILAFHYLAVFGIPGTNILSKEWEEREFEKQVERLESQWDQVQYSSQKKGKYLSYSELTEDQEDLLRSINTRSSNQDFV